MGWERQRAQSWFEPLSPRVRIQFLKEVVQRENNKMYFFFRMASHSRFPKTNKQTNEKKPEPKVKRLRSNTLLGSEISGVRNETGKEGSKYKKVLPSVYCFIIWWAFK